MLSAGCTNMPSFRLPSDDMQTPLEFFAVATVSPGKREALWRELRRTRESGDTAVKLALLQSLPGHSGYDPGTARRRLSAISYGGDSEDAALARLRLAEMAELGTVEDCRAEVRDLQQRLDKIVDIERSLDGNGNGGTKPNPAR